MVSVYQILQKKMDVFGYIIGDDGSSDCVVLDPSTEPDKIFRFIRERGFVLKAVINTHGHADHTCGNAWLLKKTGVPLYLHKKDIFIAEKISSRLFSWLIGGRPTPSPDFSPEDGDIIKAGTLKIQVIHTPGHTPGGICLLVDGNVFTGDTLFVGSVGRTDLSGGSLEILKSSVKKKLYELPEKTIVWPGHAYSLENNSTIAKEKSENPYTL